MCRILLGSKVLTITAGRGPPRIVLDDDIKEIELDDICKIRKLDSRLQPKVLEHLKKNDTVKYLLEEETEIKNDKM